ncbi:helix-turn-helix domain-containing protein [Paenibacillus elgii]|uniref:helix-turn-helix domain-containing protein n=1 Tax=Paenibacillus elgii TaxID=189691 RepID=UPI00203CC967|nr:helix-turn-helix transcriptional regulator [Paenibacillus elgii]MCM3273689.1 helix-turn-helix domain-containing protein [Paenibacillus elgii]
MNFSESVKKFLKMTDLTPSDLARQAGYSPQYIHNLLVGKKRWNETTINKVCDVLGLRVVISKAQITEVIGSNAENQNP